MKYSGFDGLLCFSVEVIAKFIIVHIKSPCPFHWGHYFLYISDESSDKVVNNRTNLFDSLIHLHLFVLCFPQKMEVCIFFTPGRQLPFLAKFYLWW